MKAELQYLVETIKNLLHHAVSLVALPRGAETDIPMHSCKIAVFVKSVGDAFLINLAAKAQLSPELRKRNG
jgi:hypothetical protein